MSFVLQTFSWWLLFLLKILPIYLCLSVCVSVCLCKYAKCLYQGVRRQPVGLVLRPLGLRAEHLYPASQLSSHMAPLSPCDYLDYWKSISFYYFFSILLLFLRLALASTFHVLSYLIFATGTGKMTKPEKNLLVLLVQAWWPEFESLNAHKNGRRGRTPQSCPLTLAHHTLWHSCNPLAPNTHASYTHDNNFKMLISTMTSWS